MIAGIDERLDGERLGALLAEGLGEPAEELELLGTQRLKSSVHRLWLETARGQRSVILKRLAPERARANQLVAQRWLPAVDLARAAPRVLGVVPETDLQAAWLACEDLGPRTLAREPDPSRIEGAATLLARLHGRFAEHALLGEVRHWGGDLGAAFHGENLRDALRALAALDGGRVEPSGPRAELLARLSARLRGLLADAPRRAARMERLGGPETLVHGDLWLENVVAAPRGRGFDVALIDWDHVAVAHPVYDLSTFLYRFPPTERRAVRQAYCDALGSGAWRLPSEPELNLLAETAEQARIANRVIWPALAARRGEGDWPFEELAMVEGWFRDLQPLFP